MRFSFRDKNGASDYSLTEKKNRASALAPKAGDVEYASCLCVKNETKYLLIFFSDIGDTAGMETANRTIFPRVLNLCYSCRVHSSTNALFYFKEHIRIYIKIHISLLHVSVFDHHKGACTETG